MIQATLIAVGTELTDGQVLDRNSTWISEQITEIGIRVREHRVVPDDRHILRQCLQQASQEAQFIVLTGGLGPTSDDFTREVLADFLGAELVFSEASWDTLGKILQARGVRLSESHRRQCLFPTGAQKFVNKVGTADGFGIEKNGIFYICLPGPPHEMRSIWEGGLSEAIAKRFPDRLKEQLIQFKCYGKGESEIADRVESLIASFPAGRFARWGYRASRPFVYVKIWYEPGHQAQSELLAQIRLDLDALLVERANEGSRLGPRFPLTQEIEISTPEGLVGVSAEAVMAKIGPLLTPERRERIRQAVAGRTCQVVPVLENIYDRGNISAVFRSAEAMGYLCAHNIQIGERFKPAKRVTAGAEKWLSIHHYRSREECLLKLRRQGFRILSTHLQGARPIQEFDFTQPTALVFGNEKDGVSSEVLDASDGRVMLPMQGFVQSYNISVAAALCLYHIQLDRAKKQGRHGDLNTAERTRLEAEYIVRTMDSAEKILASGLK